MVLRIMRSKKFSRRVLSVFAVVFIPAFLFWGVSGSLSNRPPVVGEIFGRTIPANYFFESREAMKVQVILSNFNNYTAIQNILQNRELLNSMAWERLILLDEAKREKINVTNQDVVKFIAGHPLFQKNGVFDNDIYNALLKNTLMILPRDFEEYVRENLAIRAVRHDILKDISVTDGEAADFYNNNFGKIKCSYIVIDDRLLSEDPEITEGDLEAYYELNKDDFYDPARVQIEYIEIPYSTQAEKDKARKALTSVYAKLISGGETFKKTSEEAGLRYNKPDIFSTGTVLPEVPFFPEFYETAFSLNEDEISPDISYSHPEKGSAYIMRKIKNYPREYKSFAEMKNSLVEPVLEKKRIALSRQKADEIYSEMEAQGLSLEKAADKYGLNIETTEKIGYDGYIEQLGPAAGLIAAMGKVPEGDVIAPMVSSKGAIITRLDERSAPEAKDLEEKKPRIKTMLLADKQTKALDAWFKARENRTQLRADLKEL